MKNLIFTLAMVWAPIFSYAQSSIVISNQAQNQDQYFDYNFGAVFLNTRAYVDFTLTAKGPQPSEIKRITIGGMGYDAATNCPVVLEVGKSCTLRAYFYPQFEGPAWGDFNIYLNDGNIFIRLFGNAIKT